MEIRGRAVLNWLSVYFISVLLIYVVVMDANAMFTLREIVMDAGIPQSAVLQIILYGTPAVIVLGVPFATLFAVLFGLPALASRTKVNFLRTRDPRLGRVVGTTLLFALAMGILAFILNELVVPDANYNSVKILRHEWVAHESGNSPTSALPGDSIRTPQEMNSLELYHFYMERRSPEVSLPVELTTLLDKFSIPFAGFFLAMTGLLFIIAIPSRNKFLIGLFGIICALIYWLLLKSLGMFATFGDIPPWLAAWGPNIVFLVLGLPLRYIVR